MIHRRCHLPTSQAFLGPGPRQTGKGALTDHESGLRAFREDYPDVPLHVVAQVENPFRLEDVRVLPWKTYLESLEAYLSA